METPPQHSAAEFQVTGISRSGRVRKKSSKLLDFQSPDEVEKKAKRPGRPSRGMGRGRPPAGVVRGRRLLESTDDVAEDDDDVKDDDDQLDTAADDSGAAGDSDEELNELVADIVEGVKAENLDVTNNGDSKVRQSLYMIEKSNKRKMLRDGKVVTGKQERKDKGKSRFTAYSLWAREYRKSSKFSKHQDLDFANAARRLGELWANVSNKEKSAWRRKAKIYASKVRAREQAAAPPVANTKKQAQSTYNNRPTTSRTRKLAAEREKTPPPAKQPNKVAMAITKRKRNNVVRPPVLNETGKSAYIASSQLATTSVNSHVVNKGRSQLPSIDVIDAAAHLKLLGESLSIIGDRLKEHEGQIAVSGSLSVLLDSLLCSLGPLLCLTKHIPGLEKKPKLRENLAETLDNIAYVMPGL